MSKLEELIQQYCPDGVEWKILNSFTEQFSGMTGVSNKWAESGNCMFIDYINVYKHISVDVSALKYATVKNFNQTVLKKGDILFTSASETPDECALSAVIEDEIQDGVFLDDHLFGLRIKNEYTSSISPSYLKYIFRSEAFRNQVYKVVRGVTRHYVSKVDFMKLEIPVPPLPVQEEIVRILDSFTELQAELQAELQKRKLQYSYYRDNLLSFSGRFDVKWMKLGDVASITTGRRFVRTDIQESGVPCFHYGDLYTYYGLSTTKTKGYLDPELAKKLRFAQPNDVVVVCAGENDMDIGVGVAWLGDEPAVVHDACCILHHNQNPRYISHFLRTHNYHIQMKKYVKNGKISSLPSYGLAEALIPIPSLTEQQEIADVLDRFDTLTNDLTSGLPAEIEKRQQQYEYYRDKLLTFKRKTA